MSWDVFFVGGEQPPPKAPPPSWKPPPMGTKAAVRRRLEKCLPGLFWDGYGFGVCGGDDVGFEIQLSQTRGKVGMVSICVRGSGDPFPLFRAVAKETNWHLLEDSMDVIDLDDPSSSQWEAAQQFTRQAVKAARKKK